MCAFVTGFQTWALPISRPVRGEGWERVTNAGPKADRVRQADAPRTDRARNPLMARTAWATVSKDQVSQTKGHWSVYRRFLVQRANAGDRDRRRHACRSGSI